MTTKDELRRLVDELPENVVEPAAWYLRYLRDAQDPVLRILRDAPIDDEELTEATMAALDRAEEDLRVGRVYALDDVKRELGL